jgi:two-component system chemotaxis response regulator CheY
MAGDIEKRVMIIEDASLARLYYRQALEHAGFTVSEAMNGLEALERLLVQPVDLLIVDVNMPQMDGLSFLRRLRDKPLPLGGLPALVTSSESAPQRIADARGAGANFYLVKPVSQESLVQHASLLCGVGHG